MKITIKEIAQMSGVSKATVSRVLNDSKPVSKDIRDKVLKVIEDTGYKPNYFARGLSKKKSHLIGIIIPDISNTVFSRIISSIENKLREHEYIPLISATDYDINKEIEYLQIFKEKEVDGLILLTDYETEDLKSVIDDFRRPIVMIGSDCNLDNVPVVKIDNYKAAYDAVNYLINMGHKEIGMIRGPLTDKFSGNLRYLGYRDALLDNGIKLNEDYVVEGLYGFSDGVRAMTKYLTLRTIPTAVFAANDNMAIGAMKCALDNGLKVPEHISFVGFDDIEVSSIYKPSLTTIHQPLELKGEKAAEKLVSMLEDGIVETDVILNHEIIIRESTTKI